MRNSSLGRLLAALAWILSPSLLAAEIRFEPPITADQAQRWEAAIRENWVSWETRFGGPVPRPALAVTTTSVSEMPVDWGRSRGGRIELNRSLTSGAAGAVVLHELAHVFFESRCGEVSRRAPLLSEAFALWATGEAESRAFQGGRFPYASAARDWLIANAKTVTGKEREAQAALARVLVQPSQREAWETYFRQLAMRCQETAFDTSRSVSAFFELVRGAGSKEASSRLDFLLLDGLSQDVIAQEGKLLVPFPPGSILKPTFFASVPGLMAERLAGTGPSWNCPGPPQPGEVWTWQKALIRSCNGFFLDFPSPSPDAWKPWEEELEALGLSGIPATMEERIGLKPGFTISLSEVVRLYARLCQTAPFVVTALEGTVVDGTLARASGTGWFRERRIALKTGTVRDVRNVPEHAWIVAVGPRDDQGRPSFVAAIHATGIATTALLPELEKRLTKSLTGLERKAEVQVLGLVPSSTLAVACEDGPLSVRGTGGEGRLSPRGTVLASDRLETGLEYSCVSAPLVVTIAGKTRSRKTYQGFLRVGPPSEAEVPSSVPLRERSLRARQGSRFILTTSERSYVESVLLSEFPDGRLEVLKALSLVVRNNLRVDRHPGRPICDTTHCQVFGQERSPSGTSSRRIREAVAAVAGVEIDSGAEPPVWLPFFLKSAGAWSEVRTAAGIQKGLGLQVTPRGIEKRPDGGFDVSAGARMTFSCEVLRNQLKLRSCPESVSRMEDGFVFAGHGEGHGVGLDLTAADGWAFEGMDARAILRRAYPGIRLR